MKVSDRYLLDLLREVVSLRAGGCCECPGCNETVGDPHHIFSRENKSTRYSPENCVWLCNDHHREAEKWPNDFRTKMTLIRGNAWWLELVIKKNMIVKFDNEYRVFWKEKLQKELRKVAA